MRLPKLVWFLIAAAVLVIILLLAALWLAGFIMTGKRQTLEEAMQWQSDHYDTTFYDTLEKEQYTVESSDGYVLHAELLKNPGSSRYIILSHGYTDNRCGSLKYAKMYLDLGYQCIIYDLRGHGENARTFTTYGVREGRDLAALIEDTRKRYPDLTQLGLHGESLGAATTINTLQYKPQVDFAVADCGFSDIENVLRNGFRQAHAPGVLFDLADIGAKLRYGYSLRDMRPIESLEDNTVPVLFIHGAEDTFILPKNSEDMAARTKGLHELYLIEHAGHAESVLTDPVQYQAAVTAFLEEIPLSIAVS